MTLPIVRTLLLCLCCGIFTSYVNARDLLSEPSQLKYSQLASSQYFSPIEIRVTSKQEVLTRFGKPPDCQGHMIDEIGWESLSYSTTHATIKHYQYIPLFGPLAFWLPLENQTPSTAIRFPLNIESLD